MCRTRSQSLPYSRQKNMLPSKKKDDFLKDVVTPSSLQGSTTIELDKHDIYVMGRKKGKLVFFTRLRFDGESAAHIP